MAARRRKTGGRSTRRTAGRRPRRPGVRVRKPGEGFTTDEVIAALEEEGGVLLYAAQRLGCNRDTVARYVQTYPQVAEALESILQSTLDVAERTLFQGVKAEKKVVDAGETCALTATRMLLRTKGRGRGYVMSNEVSGPDGKAVPVAVAVTAYEQRDPKKLAQLMAALQESGGLDEAEDDEPGDEGQASEAKAGAE